MKHTFVIILLFAVTFLIGGASGYFLRGTTVQSQEIKSTQERSERGQSEGMRRERDPQQMRANLIERLSLEDHQVDDFFDVLMASRREMRDFREDHRTEFHRGLTERTDSMHAQVRAILTTEQFEEWIKIQPSQNRNGGRQYNR